MRHFLIMCLAVFTTSWAHAGYLSILESGEILPENQYQFGVAPQLIVSEGGGGEIGAFVDAPLGDALSFRGMAGVGKIDFYAGGSAKYIPFPDIDNQPAIGVRGAAWYARVNSQNVTTIQVAPLVSRRFDLERGQVIPYAAVPFNITSNKDRNFTSTQFVIGSEWRNPDWPLMILSGELALNLSDSYSALNFGLAFPFDGKRGFRR